MTYDQILTLDMIIKHGGFQSASKAMSKSQPSLTQAIKNLEAEYQIKIFNRERYRPELTEDGKAFYHKALGALETFKELDIYAKELSKGVEHEVKLGLDAICSIKELKNVFESFFDEQMSSSLNLRVDLLTGLIEKVEKHEVDFAIGSLDLENEQLDSHPLFSLKMIPVISSSVIINQKLNEQLLRKIPHIILKSSSLQGDTKIYGELPRAKQWFVSDLLMKEQLISNGLGWGRLPSHLIENRLHKNDLVEIKNISNVSDFDVRMSLIKSKTKALGPTSKKLWNHLIKFYRG